MSQKGEETRQMILESATKLFAAKGFKDVTMSDICERTGLSRGGLYRHYSSTSEIFSEIISDEYSFDERIKNKESAVKILKDTLAYVEDAILEKERSLSLAIYEYANVDDHRDEFLMLEAKAKKRWMTLIRYGIRTGEFNKVKPEAAAEMILYYYQGLRMWSRVVDIGKKAAGNYSRNVMELLTGGR